MTFEQRWKNMAEGGFHPASPQRKEPRITRHLPRPAEPLAPIPQQIAVPKQAAVASSVDLLLECGLPAAEAQKWACRRSPEYVVRVVKYARAKAKSNLSGYVWRALKDEWSIPL